MLFNNAHNTKKQGDLGEARAIYEYTRLGYVVCKPLCDSAKYDLIVEKDGNIKRIQVKTSARKSKYGAYEVGLRTTGGNQSFNTAKLRNNGDYDELFILVDDGRCWMIPEEFLLNGNSINVGKDGYKDFLVDVGAGEPSEAVNLVP